MAKAKRKSIFKLAKKHCASRRCNKLFRPSFAFQKFHSDKCRAAEYNLKAAEFHQKAKELMAVNHG